MTNPHLAFLLKQYGLKSINAEKILYGSDDIKPPLDTSHIQPIIQKIIGGEGEIENTVGPLNEAGPQALDNNGVQPPKPSILSSITTLFKSKTPEEKLAVKIVKSIKNALDFINKKDNASNLNEAEHTEQVKKDIEKLRKFIVTKQIDMNYGGGFMVFDSNFNMKNMIYTCYKDKIPKFASEEIQPSMVANSVNSILQGKMDNYDSKKIVETITSKFM